MIKDGESLVNSGDTIAVELYEKYDRIDHPNYEYLTDIELNAIIKYFADVEKSKSAYPDFVAHTHMMNTII